jgi:hypothetical protein
MVHTSSYGPNWGGGREKRRKELKKKKDNGERKRDIRKYLFKTCINQHTCV